MGTRALEIELQDFEPNSPPESSETSRPQSTASSALPVPQYRLFDRIVEHDLKYLRVICLLGILPFEVDVVDRRISPSKSAIRWRLFYFIRFACLVKGLYVAVTLIASLLNPDWLEVLHLSIHLAIALVTYAIPVYVFRPKSLRLSTMLFNAALAKRDRVKTFSRQQFIAAVVPIGITSMSVVTSFGLPLLAKLLYQFMTLLTAVPTELKSESPISYDLLLVAAYALDAFSIFWTNIGIIYSVVCQVLIQEVVQSWCDDLQSKATRFNLADSYGDLVDIQIIIGFFNLIYKETVFLNKLCSFGVGILGFVLVLWYGFHNFFLGVVNLYLGIGTLFMYPLLFEKAALIFGSMEMAKKSLLMATAGLEDENERVFWRRRVKSIRIVPILCGPRPVERESLPLFYEFFVSTFIDVLLTS